MMRVEDHPDAEAPVAAKAVGKVKSEDTGAPVASDETLAAAPADAAADAGKAGKETAGAGETADGSRDADDAAAAKGAPAQSASVLSFPSMSSAAGSSQNLSATNIFANTGPMADNLNEGALEHASGDSSMIHSAQTTYAPGSFVGHAMHGRHPGLDAIEAAQYASPLSITTPSESLRSLLEQSSSTMASQSTAASTTGDHFANASLDNDDTKQQASAAAAAAASAYMQQRMDLVAAASTGALSPTHPALVYYQHVGMMGYNPTMTMGRDGQPAYYFGQPHSVGMPTGFEHPMYHPHALAAYHMAQQQQQQFHPQQRQQLLQAAAAHQMQQASAAAAAAGQQAASGRRSGSVSGARKSRSGKSRGSVGKGPLGAGMNPAAAAAVAAAAAGGAPISGADGGDSSGMSKSSSSKSAKMTPSLLVGGGPSYRADGSPPTFEEIARHSYPTFEELFTLLQNRANYEGFVLIKNTKAVNRKFIQCDRAGTRNVSRGSLASKKRDDDSGAAPKIRQRMTKKCGCPFRVNLNYSPDYFWHVTKISPHHNHPMMNTTFVRGPASMEPQHASGVMDAAAANAAAVAHAAAMHTSAPQTAISDSSLPQPAAQAGMMADAATAYAHDPSVASQYVSEPPLNLICE